MKKLILLGALLFLSSGCVTTAGVSVSHVWGNPDYVYPHIGGYTGIYSGPWGVSYIANPIFYTPYYYRRVYVKPPPPPPPPPVKHHHGYGGHHKAVFPVPNNMKTNTVSPPLVTAPVKPAPQLNNNFTGSKNNGPVPQQAQHINNSPNRKENGNTPIVQAQRREESSRTTFGTNNSNNRMSANSGFGGRAGTRR